MPIRVKVLYFAQAREAAGMVEEDISLPNRSSVKTLVRLSTRAHFKLEKISAVMRVAVNEEVAREEDRLEEGDIVAFMPPVAGG